MRGGRRAPPAGLGAGLVLLGLLLLLLGGARAVRLFG